jgi:hypothetical protein
VSRNGKWFVMCKKERALSIADVHAKVKMPSAARATLRGDVLVLAVDDVEVQVALDLDSSVAEEAREFADEFGADRPDHDQIATYDARYAITWPLAKSDTVFDTYYTIAFRIADAVGGVILDFVQETFVEA